MEVLREMIKYKPPRKVDFNAGAPVLVNIEKLQRRMIKFMLDRSRRIV